MNLLVLFTLLLAQSAIAGDIHKGEIMFAPDSSFHWSKPTPPQQNYSHWRAERDGVVSGNMKCSIIIVPVNPMIDQGMIKLVPRKKSSDKMPVAPLIPR